jgi:hypothetical protein
VWCLVVGLLFVGHDDGAFGLHFLDCTIFRRGRRV